jgi:hypothetical protein
LFCQMLVVGKARRKGALSNHVTAIAAYFPAMTIMSTKDISNRERFWFLRSFRRLGAYETFIFDSVEAGVCSVHGNFIHRPSSFHIAFRFGRHRDQDRACCVWRRGLCGGFSSGPHAALFHSRSRQSRSSPLAHSRSRRSRSSPLAHTSLTDRYTFYSPRSARESNTEELFLPLDGEGAEARKRESGRGGAHLSGSSRFRAGSITPSDLCLTAKPTFPIKGEGRIELTQSSLGLAEPLVLGLTQ